MDRTTIFKERQAHIPIIGTNEFFNACLVSDIPRVKSCLARMTLDEINQIQSNGSTALHTAAYHNNAGVVYLLLRCGALGSIKNRYGLTPFEETNSSYIKQLLSRAGNAAWIEWTFLDPPTRETKQIFDSELQNTFRRMGLPFILDFLLNQYARRYVAETLPMFAHEIERYFIDARTAISLFPVITAYTASFNFDKVMNAHCIDVVPDLLRANIYPKNPLVASIFYLIASFNFDPMLRPKYAFTGRVHRGLKMSIDYIRTYKKNELVVNRAFLSTSTTIQITNIFAGFDQSNQFRQTQLHNFIQAAVRLTYHIRRPETRAINISSMSTFRENEEEILLMPISAFRIIDIKSDVNGSKFDITLEDCDLPSKDDLIAPIVRCDFAELPIVPLIMPVSPSFNKSAMNTTNPLLTNSVGWRRRLATSIMNMSTRATIIFLVAIIIFIILILLAILLPILLRSSCNNNGNLETLFRKNNISTTI